MELVLGLWFVIFVKFGIFGFLGGLGVCGGGVVMGWGGGGDFMLGYVWFDEWGVGFMGCNWGGVLGFIIILDIRY